jgi:hypothetical protein
MNGLRTLKPYKDNELAIPGKSKYARTCKDTVDGKRSWTIRYSARSDIFETY